MYESAAKIPGFSTESRLSEQTVLKVFMIRNPER
jgi:hypothetical protein